MSILEERAETLLNQFKEKSNTIANKSINHTIRNNEDVNSLSDSLLTESTQNTSDELVIIAKEEYFEGESIPTISNQKKSNSTTNNRHSPLSFVDFQRGIMNELKSVLKEKIKD